MIQRQTTFPLIPLVAASGMLLMLAATGVEQATAHGIQLSGWIPSGVAHATVTAPMSHPAGSASNPVTRTIIGVPGRAVVAPIPAATTTKDQRSVPITGARCPTKPGIDKSCAAP